MSTLHHLFAPFLALAGLLSPGWLGVTLDPDSEQAVVVEVVPDSPAAKSGIQPGDVILAVDGKTVATAQALVQEVARREAGTKVKVKLRRADSERVLEVELGERPADLPVPPPARETAEKAERETREVEKVRAGEEKVKAEEAPPQRQERPAGRPYLGVQLEETDDGVAVTDVLDGTPAGKAGVVKGRLLELGGRRIESLADVDAAMAKLRPGQEVQLRVQAGDADRRFAVVAGSGPARTAERAVGRRDAAAERTRAAEAERAAREDERAARQAEREAAHAARAEAQKKEAEAAAKAKAAREQAAKQKEKEEAAAKDQQAKAAQRKADAGPARRADVAATLRELQGKQPLLLVFGSTWDASSKALQKSLDDEKVKAALGQRKVLWIDTDQHGAIADRYNVQQIPHMVLLDAAGKPAGVIEGFQPAEMLAEKLGQAAAPATRAAPKAAKPAPEPPKVAPQPPAVRPAPARPAAPRERAGQAEAERDLSAEIRALREEIRELRALLQELTREQRRR